MTITISGSGNPLDVDGTNTGFYSTLMTAQATTSGTSKDFTGIPSWVKRITVLLDRVSSTGSGADLGVQLGTSSGIISTGYYSRVFWYEGGGVGGTGQTFTNGFGLTEGSGISAAGEVSGICIMNKFSDSSNIWSYTSQLVTNVTQPQQSCGYVDLGSTLTQLRFTMLTVSGTFDLGSVNVMYE